jgi:hypothetical protein
MKLLILFILFLSCSSTKEYMLSVGQRPITPIIRQLEVNNEVEVLAVDSSITKQFGTVIIKYNEVK